MARIIIKLENIERDALVQLAGRELRDPRDQAALIIRHALTRRGFLSAPPRRARSSERVHALGLTRKEEL